MSEHPKISINLLPEHIKALRAIAADDGEKALSVVVRGIIRTAAQQRGLWPAQTSQKTQNNSGFTKRGNENGSEA